MPSFPMFSDGQLLSFPESSFAVWICNTYNTLGKTACPSKAIPETVLDSLVD